MTPPGDTDHFLYLIKRIIKIIIDKETIEKLRLKKVISFSLNMIPVNCECFVEENFG